MNNFAKYKPVEETIINLIQVRVKKISLLLLLLIGIIGNIFAQMSDEQIIKMVQDAQKQGMSQQQIVIMLTQKGVTKEKLMQLKAAYEEKTQKSATSATGTSATTDSRLRTKPVNKQKTSQKNELTTPEEKEKEAKDRRFLKELPEVKDEQILDVESADGMSLLDSLTWEIELNERLNRFMKEKEKKIFGRDIFNNEILTFEPLLNIATPDNYVLGPGDEVIIDVWGASQDNIRETISPDGNIIVQGYGPLHLSGLTAKEANARVKNELSKIYSGINTGNSSILLTLGNIRSIQVNVMGEVLMPGTYTLPSLASVFHALYNAGGVNPIGTLRSIKVFRGGKEVADVDIYEYLLKGKNNLNITLQDGDVIVVNPYENQVTLEGKIKRPMLYEMKKDEVVSDLLQYAGGFTGDAYKKSIRVIRKSGRERQVFNVDDNEFNLFTLSDGDMVTVDSVLDRFENRIEVRGAVYREGLYALGEDMQTVKQLLEKAEGLRGDAFPNRAVIYREKPDLSMEVLAIDVLGIASGKVDDIKLKKNDVLYIPSIFELREDYTIAVKGDVGHPGTYKFVDNMTLEDLVVQAGGLLESASTIRVDVSRRIKDPKSTSAGDRRAETYTFALKNGLIVSGPSDFSLQPFDEIYVRRSPGYQKQQNVLVEGEVVFGGEYTLAKKGERLSDLVKRAGGLTAEAYPEGARLTRKLTDDEKAKVQTLLKLTQQGGKDSINVNQLDIGDTYFVGIELNKALENPGSDEWDIILREGDALQIPEYNGTVKISGAVMYPNTVVYKNKAKLKHYISQSGGYAQRAKKSRAFVIYMNGTVAVAKGNRTKLTPGCEIVVPLKPRRQGMGLAEIMSLASSTTSMAAMVTSIINSSK